jgi:RimJ/RimL family protein N-acetyltransferase
MKVYLRPLQEADAEKSWKWRNDPSIWKFTGNRPSKYITAETELNWMRDALNRSDEIRFAICAGYFKEYVGNVQLTSITSDDAEFHIFIGEKLFRNQGVGSKATQLVTEYAKKNLRIKNIYLHVHPENIAAIRAYIKCGFVFYRLKNDILIYIKDLYI